MDIEEIVWWLGNRRAVSIEELNDLLSSAEIAPEDIEALMSRLSEAGIAVTEADAASALEPANQDELRETVDRVMASLTPDEKRVLRSRFALGENSRLTIEQIDRQFSVTRERIRQIEEKALSKLKKGAERQVHGYAFRPVAPDDLPGIADWLRRPHVARWWSEDPAEQIETTGRHLIEAAFEALIMLLDDRPVGYLQVYDASPGTVSATAHSRPAPGASTSSSARPGRSATAMDRPSCAASQGAS